ncbi:MAG: hypothetical protein J3K34DRAFT_522568, partial [Monoraphidium minutum]
MAGGIGAAAFEIWTTDRGYVFDGVLVAPEAAGGAAAAGAYRRDVWRRRYWEEYACAEAAHRQKQISEVPAPARWVMMAFEVQPLARLRGAAVPLLELLFRTPALAYVLLLAPPLLLALVLALRRKIEGTTAGAVVVAPAAAAHSHGSDKA